MHQKTWHLQPSPKIRDHRNQNFLDHLKVNIEKHVAYTKFSATGHQNLKF
jgi:hypothetical protein